MKVTRFSRWDQSLGRGRVCVCACVCWSLCATWSGAMNTTVCNLFLFPKKPYCCCDIMKSLLTSYSDWTLFYTLHRWLFYFPLFFFFFWFGFSFLTAESPFFFKDPSSKRKKDKCLFVHIMFKDILFFHCRNLKYNVSVWNVCVYVRMRAHVHTFIYI